MHKFQNNSTVEYKMMRTTRTNDVHTKGSKGFPNVRDSVMASYLIP